MGVTLYQEFRMSLYLSTCLKGASNINILQFGPANVPSSKYLTYLVELDPNPCKNIKVKRWFPLVGVKEIDL